jgi:hypothetical protein
MNIMNGLKVLGLDEARAYFDYFNIKYDPITEKKKLIQALEENSPLYKSDELVRWELAADDREWPKKAVDVIMDAAKALRMLEPETPIVGDFDAAVQIGGANQAPLIRAKYVLDAISRGQKIAHLILTGSKRRILKDGERNNVRNYAPDAITEFDLAKAVFDKLAPGSGDLRISLCPIDMEFAHNYNVLDYVISEYYQIRTLDYPSICAVSTQIYQPALELDLLRAARNNEILPENILAAATPSSRAVIDGRTPLSYLAELNRTFRAAVEEATA